MGRSFAGEGAQSEHKNIVTLNLFQGHTSVLVPV